MKKSQPSLTEALNTNGSLLNIVFEALDELPASYLSNVTGNLPVSFTTVFGGPYLRKLIQFKLESICLLAVFICKQYFVRVFYLSYLT